MSQKSVPECYQSCPRRVYGTHCTSQFFVPAFLILPGRPLPPLFNWLEGELGDLPPDVVRKLAPKPMSQPAPAPA